MKWSYSVLAVDEEPAMEKPQSLIGEVMPWKACSCFAVASHAVTGGRKGGKESRMGAVISGLASAELLGSFGFFWTETKQVRE